MAVVTPGNNRNNTINGTNDAGDIIEANGGNDVVNAGDGNDSVYGSAGNDTLNGQNGDDDLYGGTGADQLFGGAGNDVLDGGAGNDVLNGGDGIDTASFSNETGAVTVTLANGTGTGTATGTTSGSDTLTNIENVVGGSGNDTITGNNVANALSGGAGADSMMGGAGNDTMSGGLGNDRLFGEGDNDLVSGGSGADSLFGGDGSDTLNGGDGNDSLEGGTGADLVYGGGGADIISGGDGNDTLAGDISTPAANLSLNWTGFGADEQFIGGTATQDTGGVVVSVSHRNDGNFTGLSVESSDPVYVNTAAGEPFNDRSNASLNGGGVTGGTATVTVGFEGAVGSGFADTVSNVTFRIADMDANPNGWRDVITIRAYDANGNLVPVTLTFAGATQTGTTPSVSGTADLQPTNPAGSLLVSIPGPVAYFEIDYDQAAGGGQLVLISDIHFTSIPATEGNDTITGGVGDDLIDGGGGNDSLLGDEGNDQISGGTGDDQLFGGIGNDTLDGGDGADFLDAGDGDDVSSGGAGNDTIHFGAGNDTVFGGAGDDVIDDLPGQQLQGNTLLYGGDGNDTIWSGGGNDTLFGDAGNDVLNGEGDDDILYGGDGIDDLFGGDGSDTLYGGNGADNLYGGNDRDLFFGGPGDTIFGGDAGDNYDTLDLQEWGKDTTNIHFDPGSGRQNGYVEFLNSDGTVAGTLFFSGIENIIPCFTPGTLITTPQGPRRIEDLQPGDLVLTRDSGFQEICWAGRRDLGLADLLVNPALRPVRIAKGALGAGLPQRDMLVSPQHRMLIEGARAELLFGEREVLVAALHLVGQPGIEQVTPRRVSYIHVMCSQHEIVQAEGAWTESFQPGIGTLDAMDCGQRTEVLMLFPELADPAHPYRAARATLKAHEARVLLAA